jgi:propanol-preferring alcohol dehydrogenase
MSRNPSMRAMVLEQVRQPLKLQERDVPEPGPGQVLLEIRACAVCRTDLHVVDGELPHPKLPLIIGHEIVGRVIRLGEGVSRMSTGARVGVPWLGWTDGVCSYCTAGQENLCPQARFTGYTLDGGYAEYAVADERFCVAIPESYSDTGAAPLLCAGLIGYRSLVRAGGAKRLGIYGFGAAAHILAQVALYQGREIYAFTRPGDERAQHFAQSLGATWAGGSGQRPPEELDAAIIFAPVGALVPVALAAVRPGGTVVCGGIHMSDVPSFPYELLWGERTICSVANLTRKDADEFMQVAPKVPVRTTTQLFPLEQANEALKRLRTGQLEGAAVLTIRETR